MKTRLKIILTGIILTFGIFGAYQSIMYQCENIPMFAQTPANPTLLKCLSIWEHQLEQK